MNNLMVFENKKVEVFEWNGQVLFNPYHCGECLGLGESAVSTSKTPKVTGKGQQYFINKFLGLTS